MARLLSWPVGVRANFREPLSGPRAIGSGSTDSVEGFNQSYSSPFGLWSWRFAFPPLRGQEFRRYRGLVTALHGGANAVRVSFCDWDGLSFNQRGVQANTQSWRSGQPWGNSLPWDNNQNWQSSNPLARVVAASSKDDTQIKLAPEYFGHQLDIGDMIGFSPFHFGLYTITEVFEPGHYRIWPKLRKAIGVDDYATLNPVLAMRLAGQDAAPLPREAAFATGLSISLIECLDYDVRDYWTD